MKVAKKYFIWSFIIILLSTPVAYRAVRIVYFFKNLSGEYTTILNGFIHANMLIGVLVFVLGLDKLRLERK